MFPNRNKRTVRFFEITGKTLVHPMTYRMYDFQKEIITTAVQNDTLIVLPAGLGKSFLAAVITFNFHRWFLNSKIIVLSQTKSYLADQISAYNSFTTLCPDSYIELSTNKDVELSANKSILLTTPQRFLDCLKNQSCNVQNLILLVIFESTKISKCHEYKEILEKLNNILFRTVILLDPVGFNAKTIKQIIDTFSIIKIAKKDMNSPDVLRCTYFSTFESITVDISRHITSIKDAFYAVFEKYGKKLKDAKVISGNVASLTKAQVQKCKEKFIKDPPRNMSKEIKDDLIDSMTVCSFLCHGIELLHNWGVRIFYEYLFDDNKDDELKSLIVKDESLKHQMKMLNEYLKSNGTKYESAISRIIHPKILQLKNAIARCFSNNEEIIEKTRIIVVCSIERVVDDINRVFVNLPECVRYHCIKTNAKCLSTEPEHKDIIKRFEEGVINVLVVSNLVEEVTAVKSSLVIALEPNKAFLKLADARFNEGPEKCLFILTRGNEFTKYETLMNEKRNEQKPLEIDPIEENKTSPLSFPPDFNPEFECSSIKNHKLKLKNSPVQKTLVNYFNKSDSGTFRTPVTKKSFAYDQSPSLFADSFGSTSRKLPDDVNYEEIAAALPEPIQNCSPVCKIDEHDSFDDLILDFPANFFDSGKKTLKASTPVCDKIARQYDGPTKKLSPVKSPKKLPEEASKQLSPGEASKKLSPGEASNKLSPGEASKKVNITLAELPNESFVDDLFADSPEMVDDTFETERAVESNRKVSIELKDIENESFCDSLFDDSPKWAEKGTNSDVESDPELFSSGSKDDKSINFDSGDDNIFESGTAKCATKSSTLFDDKLAPPSSPKPLASTVAVDIPSNFFDDTKPDGFGERNSNELNSSQSSTSPIICSAKRKFRRKPTPTTADQSSSIQFGSYDREKSRSKSAFDNVDLTDKANRLRTAKLELLMASGAVNGGSFFKSTPPSISAPDDDFITSGSRASMTRISETIREAQSSTPISSKTNSAKKRSFLRRSRPLFDDSGENCVSSGAVGASPRSAFENVKRTTTNGDLKKRLFSNFAQSVKRKITSNSDRNIPTEINGRNGEKERIEDSDVDEFPWLKTSPPPSSSSSSSANTKQQNEDCFKKTITKPKYDSRPTSNDNKRRLISPAAAAVASDSSPNSRRTKKRMKQRRKLAEEFIDAEAEVSGEDSCTSTEDFSQLYDDSFIDDDSTNKRTNVGNYLKSVKSPRVAGQFRIPIMSESRLKLNVYSQAVVDDVPSYENDSFCVDDEESESETSYIPSILTQMERKLERKSKKSTAPQFKRIRIIEDSSPDSPQLTRNTIRKRIRRVSSDSDE